MALRWKKDERDKGLAGVAACPGGSTLRIDGNIRAAMVYPLNRSGSKWYWVAGWEARELGVPHKNTCDDPTATEADAKAAALAYVRSHLAPNACDNRAAAG